MKLPGLDRRHIPEGKLAGYLLDAQHQTGCAKAGFFVRFGFDRERPDVLGAALMAHAGEHDVVDVHQAVHGMVYGVEGPLPCPDGRTPRVRAVWMVRDDGRPRLVTAYPA